MQIPDVLLPHTQVKIVAAISWCELQKYLVEVLKLSCKTINLEGVSNDSYHCFDITPDEVEAAVDDRKEIIEKANEGSIEEYMAFYLIALAVADGHLPIGNYQVYESW